MQEITLKVRYCERGFSKSLEKGNFLFSFELSTFHQKEKRPGTSNQWLFMLRNKFRKIALLVMNYLTKLDDVLWLLSYSKKYICKFMQANL